MNLKCSDGDDQALLASRNGIIWDEEARLLARELCDEINESSGHLYSLVQPADPMEHLEDMEGERKMDIRKLNEGFCFIPLAYS
eukprot:IDg14132t1